MKHSALLSLALIGLSLPVAAQAPLTPIHSSARTLTVNNSTRLTVLPDTITALSLVNDKVDKYLTNEAGRLTLDAPEEVTLHLRPGDIRSFIAEDRSQITFIGNFAWADSLSLNAEDASAIFFKDRNNSISAPAVCISAADIANIDIEGSLLVERFKFSPDDASSISINTLCLNAVDHRPTGGHVEESQYGSLTVNNWIADGDTTSYSPQYEGFGKLMPTINKAVREYDAPSSASSSLKARLRWRPNTDLAFGFHNWGSQPFDGFAGVQGPAAVRTSFNNVQLSFNYPLVRTSWMAIYAGIGLEWDKYRFSGTYISLSDDATSFVDLSRDGYRTQLLTRYVEVPISVKFRLSRRWKLELAAIPGFHWSGSHTGFRRSAESDDISVKEKDYSVNDRINPYKLDARVVLRYRALGVYVQVPTLSTMRSDFDNLYPIKFGIIL